MRAAVWRGPGRVAIEDRPLPGLRATQLRVRVAWCGVCGSDREEYSNGPAAIPRTPRVARDGIVLGHEFAGVVEEVGTAVTGFEPGDRVTADTLVSCCRCFHCQRGEITVCPDLDVVGLTLDGGFAEYVDLDPFGTHRLPENVGLDAACLAEPLGVAVRAVRRNVIKAHARVAVIGAGTVGLLIAWYAQQHGADVVVCDREPGRAESAARLGVRFAKPGDLPRSHGPMVYFDCTGAATVAADLVRDAPPQSRVVIVGVCSQPARVDLYRLLVKEVALVGSVSHDRADFLAAVGLLAEHSGHLAKLITHRVHLEDAARVFASLADGMRTPMRILLGPGGEPWADM